MNDILYKFAFDENKKLINIDEVKLPSKEIYTCPKCGYKLAAKLGNLRKHHFSHYDMPDTSNCSYESYLHNISKILFVNEYNYCLDNNVPFYLSVNNINEIRFHDLKNNFKTEFKTSDELSLIDLTKYYKVIEKEKKYNNFVPDIMLLGEESEIFIEIYVTHKSSDLKKINNSIIEIKIEKIEDIFSICKNGIREDGKNISIHNVDTLREKKIINKYPSVNEKKSIENIVKLFEIMTEIEKNSQCFELFLEYICERIYIGELMFNSSIKYIKKINLLNYFKNPKLVFEKFNVCIELMSKSNADNFVIAYNNNIPQNLKKYSKYIWLSPNYLPKENISHSEMFNHNLNLKTEFKKIETSDDALIQIKCFKPKNHYASSFHKMSANDVYNKTKNMEMEVLMILDIGDK